jgi:nucleotide-binding universal stress UspA family protein
MVIIAQRMMTEARQNKRHLHTPSDFTVVNTAAFERLSRARQFAALKNVSERDINRDLVLCDIGEATRWGWSDWFGPARTIFWHGPVGISEIDLFCAGSRFLARELTNRTWPTVHRVVICGDSLLAALQRPGFPQEKIKHASYAGQAALHYFAERPLPAVDVLQRIAVAKAEPARVLIPLNGSERDTQALHAATEAMARDAQIFLLHVRSGPDEEQYPDIGAGLNESEKLARRIESERIFARANAILAARGLLSTQQVATQGAPIKVILRYARRIKAELIVLTATGPLQQLGARRLIDRAPCAALVARSH